MDGNLVAGMAGVHEAEMVAHLVLPGRNLRELGCEAVGGRRRVGEAAAHAANEEVGQLVLIAHEAKLIVHIPRPVGQVHHGCRGPMARGVRAREEVRIHGRAGAGFVIDGLQFLDAGQTPVGAAGERKPLGILQRRFPAHARRHFRLLPGQARVQVRDGAIQVIGKVTGGARHRTTDAPNMIPVRAAGADRLIHPVRPDAAAGVNGPDTACIRELRVGRPPVLRGGEGEEVRVQRRVDQAVVQNAERLVAGRKPPVALASNPVRLRVEDGAGPGHFTPVGLLPGEAGDIVLHCPVAIVGEGRRVDGVIGILPKSGCVSVGLAGIGQLEHAPGNVGGVQVFNHVRIQVGVDGRARRVGDLAGRSILHTDEIAHGRAGRETRDLAAVIAVPCCAVLMRSVIQHGGGVRGAVGDIGQGRRCDVSAARNGGSDPDRLGRKSGRVGRGGDGQRIDDIAVGDHAVGLADALVGGQEGANVIHLHPGGGHGKPGVARIGKLDPGNKGIWVVGCVVGICGIGQGLVGHAIELLPNPDMVVPLDKGGDVIGDHQLMEGQRPCGTVGSEPPASVDVLAAPLVLRRLLDAAAPRAQHVMRKHKLVFGIAALQGLPKPRILCVAVGHIPHVGSFHARPIVVVHAYRIRPVGIYCYEEGVAPGPGVVILELANERHSIRVARVESVRGRLGVIQVPRVLGPNSDVVGRAVQEIGRGLLVVAVDEEQRGTTANQPQIGTLHVVLRRDKGGVD